MAKKSTAQQIIDSYSHYVISHGKVPPTVFAFMEENKWKEVEFYAHFASFAQLDEEIFYHFFEQTHKLMSKEPEFETMDAQNKLLTFYYTFFEILTANRSFVVFALHQHKEKMKTLKMLQKLHQHFKMFIASLNINTINLPAEILEKIKNRGMEEGAWLQLLMAMKFWLDDTSSNFEKTDVYIEKSIQATFDLLQTPPLQSVVDFGKFLYQEKIHSKI